MSLVSILFTSVGLGMDAFAVSICKGLSIKNYSIYTMRQLNKIEFQEHQHTYHTIIILTRT